ncbi:HEAT repeat domain-containing protein [Promicromonospora sp. NPDC060204]|uniref:HEAT repeat domain-containing protein n=1 Tax=Promicromonospora sp. NPDC060204 TaxID=3347071 RepID=UPI00365A7BE5
MAGPDADGASALVAAVGYCLAPLKVSQVFDPAVEYVVHGSGPGVLERLRERPEGTKLIAEPEGYHPKEQAAAVADLHPGWTRQDADAALRTVYRTAPVDVLARFGQVLHAVFARAGQDGEPSWLLMLAHDVARLSSAKDAAGAADVRLRWSPDVVAEIARTGGAPGRSAEHATLSALLYGDHHHGVNARREMLESDAGAAFLARHTDALAEVARGLDLYLRRQVAALCERGPQAHADLLAELAVDADAGVRVEALAALSRLDGPRQIEVLRRHLRTAPPDRLPDTLARLAGLDGGVVAIEETLAGGEAEGDGGVGPLDPDRERLLRRVVVRVRVLRPAQADSVPPVVLPQDAKVAEELRALHALPPVSRPGDWGPWHSIGNQLARIPDVRALRDARRATGRADADRWAAELLVTRTGRRGRKLGAVLTPEDAESWWPLFAERLDLADEYLDGGDGKRHPDEEAVDTRAMILTILARFPAVPEPLVPRLTSFALAADRHRLAARRVLGDHPGARAAARAALSDGDATTRSSAAEWLVELGEPGVVGPEPGWDFGPGVLPASVRNLPPSTLSWLDRFRERALDRGVPADDVDRWLGLARPTLRTAPDRGGPVVGRLGSPLMLPPDAPTPGTVYGPDRTDEYQLIATLDLAAMAPGATDLALPPDGHLLLFANVELEDELLAGGAVYVPAGTPVEEREASPAYEPYEYDSPEDLDEALRHTGDLRLVPGVSLPSCPLDAEAGAEHPHAETLQAVWSEQSDGGGEWELGGHAYDFDGYGDPASGSAFQGPGEGWSRPEDWVVLAQWVGVPMGILYWTITRQDLEVRRFDRVVVQMYANP